MEIKIVTNEELDRFRIQLLSDFKQLLANSINGNQKQYVKSCEARKILNISSGTLQSLRTTGKLKPTKILGTMYYSMDEIQSLLSGK